MNEHILIPIIGLIAVAGCTKLSEEDRALLSSANQAAMEAKQQAADATEEARRAREAANRAAAEAHAAQQAAETAADKSDRIFREGQNK